MTDSQITEIERFFLYEEADRATGEHFLHVEHLDKRSRPANWKIRSHVHKDLHQLFEVTSGGGAIIADGVQLSCKGPCVVVVPTGVVHGFKWESETVGRVLTFSDSYLQTLLTREPQLELVFRSGLWTTETTGASIADGLNRLDQEIGWNNIGLRLAVEAHLSVILVELLRQRRHIDHSAVAPPSPKAKLVARFRELVEKRYREHPSISDCAEELAVSPGKLRAACSEVVQCGPNQLIQKRLTEEAKRLMSYSNMSITQIALYLGFSDPAYFSRAFRAASGQSPRAYQNASARAVEAVQTKS